MAQYNPFWSVAAGGRLRGEAARPRRCGSGLFVHQGSAVFRNAKRRVTLAMTLARRARSRSAAHLREKPI